MANIEMHIAKPCNQSWTAMKGDEQVRHCQVCRKNVYNIAEMTSAEVEDLIKRTDGKFCARLYRRSDNRVMTKDCPKGVAMVRRRRVLALSAVGAAIIAGFPLVRPVYAGSVRTPASKPKAILQPVGIETETTAVMGDAMVPPTARMGRIASVSYKSKK